MKKNISLEEAQSLLLGRCQLTKKEYVSLPDSLDRVISEDIKAEENIPPFDRSPLDGYAFRAEDTEKAGRQNPVTLEVIEEVPAGYAAKKKIVAGTAIKVMTGAPIPEGADAVEKYENTQRNRNFVKIFSSFKSGENIILAGEDVVKGEVVAGRGMVVTPPVIGLLASLGICEVPVFKRPKVAIVSTGDELLDISEPLQPGKIRNSNRYSLEAYIKDIGAEPVIIGTAKDKTEEAAELIAKGIEVADMVITTGGVSVGDYDVVQDAVECIGAETLFWKIDIKPGSPTLAAVKDGKVILGLSGNPASALVVFQLLGSPFIKKMAGRTRYLPEKIEAVLKEDFRKPSPKRRFLRGKLLIENGTAFIKLTGDQGNVVLRSMVGCNALAEVPEGSGPLKAGEKLNTYLVDKIEW